MIRACVLSCTAVLAFAASVTPSATGFAQETTTTTTTPKSHAVTAEIETADVIYVSGDDAVLKLPDGSLRLLAIPAGTPLSVNGKPAKVSDLTAGSTITHVKASSRTESEVTTVTQINGTVTRKYCPYLTIRLNDGTSKGYRVPANAKFTIDGQPGTCQQLTVGAKLAATALKTEGLSTEKKGAALAAQTPPQIGVLLIERR